QPVEVLYAPPGFESGTLRPSHGGIPLLFPFAGRLRGRELTFRGTTYSIGDLDDHMGNAIHGYVLNRPWQLIEASPRRAVGQFHAATLAPGLLKKWPADFRLTVSYELSGRSLVCDFTIENPDDKPLPLGLGTHPYFRLPLGLSGQPGDCLIRVPATQAWLRDGMLPSGAHQPLAPTDAIARGLRFADSELDDIYGGLEFQGGLCRPSVEDPASGRTLTQEFDDFFRACVVFNPPHREAICIEPYSCVPNAFELETRGIDAGLRVLEPGGTIATRITIRLS
ncbi:MAG TPA: aldose 1-epimerase, partial [Pirellulales bacterium]|nr:aldose 1-epimerase [Pirellulales bacterium]